MNNETETRADNTANYTCITNVPLGGAMARALIYKCDLFGDNHSVVISFYEKKELPNWFRRQCQRFFLGTKWTKV